MDDAALTDLNRLHLPEIVPISIHDFESGDTAMREAKQNRSLIEYYFTSTPSLLLYVMNHWPAIDVLTYVDADVFFFASPAPLFEEMGSSSIAIIRHNFSPGLRDREIYGIYNVGWLSFRRDENAAACLAWWRAQCIEWCYDRLDNGRYADQKYLDDWPARFHNVKVIEHKGANLALWNVGNYTLHTNDEKTVMVDGDRLIFYHFHKFKQTSSLFYDPGWRDYNVSAGSTLRTRVYKPYLQCLLDCTKDTQALLQNRHEIVMTRYVILNEARPIAVFRRAARTLAGVYSVCRDLFTAKYIICITFGQWRTFII
jgi:hypothetical protein